MVPSDSNDPTTTTPGTAFARLTIEINRSGPIGKILNPPLGTPLEISFTHPAGAANHGRPHRIEWVALNLLAGERIEIQLDTAFPGYSQNPPPMPATPWWEHLQRLFPTAVVLPSGAFGWELTFGGTSESSGVATGIKRFELRGSGAPNRPLLHYNIVFFDANGAEHAIDPDIVVTPDP